MGGGYDNNEDVDPVAASDTMGRAIVVLDAVTGNTVWTACKAGCTTTVSGMAYAIPDTSTGTSVASGWTTLTESLLTDETGAAAGGTPYSSTGITSGFYVTLQNSGEKAVNAPLTVAGHTYFGTNTPADPAKNPDMCYPNLGIARGYAINFLTGAGLNDKGYITLDGGGLPPSPVFGLVEINPGSGVYTPVLIGGGNQTGPAVGGNNTSALGANKVTPPNTGKRKRTCWFTEGLKQASARHRRRGHRAAPAA